MLGLILLLGILYAEFSKRTHFDVIAKHLLFFAALGAVGYSWHTFNLGGTVYIARSFYLCYISLILTAVWLPLSDALGLHGERRGNKVKC